MKGPNTVPVVPWNISLPLLILKLLTDSPVNGHPVIVLDVNSPCKISHAICSTNTDSFDLHLRLEIMAVNSHEGEAIVCA